MTKYPIFNNHRGGMGRSLRLPGICVAEIHNSGENVAEHAHQDAHFWLMVRGYYRVETSHETRSIGPATLVYTAAGEPHRDHITTPEGFGMTIAVAGNFSSEHLGDLELPKRSMIIADPHALWAAQRVRAELHVRDPASPTLVAGLALDLLGQLCRANFNSLIGQNLVERARAFVRESFTLPGLSVRLVARELGVHPVHLARSFRELIGTTPVEYIRSYRCKRAAQMLQSGTEPIAAIAVDCGFSDQSSFTRAFRRSFGTTPAAFRRLNAI
jgi:AraC family transcriptional regulator